jgi:uncharacterized protein YraI
LLSNAAVMTNRSAWLVLAATLLAACAPGTGDVDPQEGVADENAAVSGSLTVGAKLIATTDVNLRKSASTSASILHVIPKGASVTVVSADPQSGFYNVSHAGVTGWSYGTYYNLDTSGSSSSSSGSTSSSSGSTSSSSGSTSSSSGSTSSSGGPATVTPAGILAALGSCSQLSGTSKFRKDAGGSSTVSICGASGAVWWTADMDIDCDGGSGATCQNDPDYQPDTATTDSKGNPLDASTLPYVVIPGSSNGFNYKTAGLKMGSVVAVIYNGKISYGILGDVGPQGVIGEASYAMAKELGINASPTSGGVDSGVTYVAFTGTAAVVSKKEDHAAAVSIGQQKAADLVAGK